MKKYWLGFTLVILVSFSVLGWVGAKIYQQAPPIAERVVTATGQVVFESGAIEKGQNVWQAMGGMEVGSIWGHGSYTAPDWTADWLHREAMFILNEWSKTDYNTTYSQLDVEKQSLLQARLSKMMRNNTYDPTTNQIRIEEVRARAIEDNVKYYSTLFSEGSGSYAIQKGSVTDPVKLRELSAFFFWSSWAASTNRPGDNITYTSNWPHEKLVDNQPTGDSVVWTGVSIIMLLAGIGGMAWFYASREKKHPGIIYPSRDPLLGSKATPSQLAVVKYFWTVAGLFLLQILMGVISAHYGVEGNKFYGFDIAKILPYSVVRTWHTQLGIFWIATAWLAAGLYISPAVSGVEPKGQRLGVNLLFGALVVVVLGSMAGEWMSIMGLMPDKFWFFFGHSGYEYIDLGRFFQIALFIGLVLWLFLMVRALRPALKNKDEQKPILTLFLISSVAIALFYASALMYGKHTNLAVAEFWRWWVVHLWVEGFFEVFATVVIAFLFARLGLLNIKTAGQAAVLSSTIFLSGGIIGTLHHLYFSGTPTFVLALGSVFSALEVVPLLFVGYEAWENYKLSKAKEWVINYKWPIYFFIAVAFWNMLGAGLFGFMINPPVALYYMQGLNTTPVHGHAALFGVYGMLGLGLMLFTLRALKPGYEWDSKLLSFGFWAINIGLFSMVVFSLLPVGLMQTWASVEHGYWYARSSEFLQTGVMQTLRWMRVFGDTIFAAGVISLILFVGKLTVTRSYEPTGKEAVSEAK
ncbi:MAG: nitric-oxide reductase large subunit [Ignavibacteria bacterium]|jgi:nitric oxide reductase subunit B|nr:nitric-oxide reductase large subunit [Ignavibacteria bacterium]MCU7520684.1 nitric-oxide reductase large subunit [Ignavibacteria bacterium]HEX2962491.1 nitric-oxide reductase large subunit [Ignavibacteriales bacterium]